MRNVAVYKNDLNLIKVLHRTYLETSNEKCDLSFTVPINYIAKTSSHHEHITKNGLRVHF